MCQPRLIHPASLEINCKCKSFWKTDVCISVGHSPEHIVGLLRCKIVITQEWLAQPRVAWGLPRHPRPVCPSGSKQQLPFHRQENRAPSRGASLDAPRVSGQAGTQPPDLGSGLFPASEQRWPPGCAAWGHRAGLWSAGRRSGLHRAPGPPRTGPGLSGKRPCRAEHRFPLLVTGRITALARLL